LIAIDDSDDITDDSLSSKVSIVTSTGISEEQYAFLNGYGMSLFFVFGSLFTVFENN